MARLKQVVFVITLFVTVWVQSVQAQADDPANQCAAGTKLYAAGQYAEAQPLLEAGVSGREQGHFASIDNQAYCMVYLGNIYYQNLNNSKALSLYTEALKLLQSTKNRSWEGSVLTNIGMAYMGLYEYTQAIPYFEQSLTIKQELGERASQALPLQQLGLAYQFLSQYDDALAAYEPALALYKEAQDVIQFNNTAYYMGSTYLNQGLIEKAITHYEQILAYQKQIGDNKGVGITLNRLAAIYSNQNQYKESLSYYQQAVALQKEIKDSANLIITLQNIGVLQQQFGYYEEAIKVLDEALALADKINNTKTKAAIVTAMGTVYQSLAMYNDALKYYQQGLDLALKSNQLQQQAPILQNIGLIHYYLANYDQALDHFEKALAIKKQLGEADTNSYLSNIATVYQALGDYDKALDYNQQALMVAQNLKNRLGESTILGNIALIYQNKGEYQQALKYHQQALVIEHELDDIRGQGTTLSNIGTLYSEQGQLDDALNYYKQAYEFQEKSQNYRGAAITFNNIALIYQKRNDHELALEFFQKALMMIQQTGDRANEAIFLGNIGVIYNDQDQLDEALDYYLQALKIQQEIGDKESQASTLSNIAVIYDKQNKFKEALKYYQQALTIEQAIGDRSSEGRTLGNLGVLYYNQKQFKEALKALQQALAILEDLRTDMGSEESRTSFIAQYANLYDLTINILHELGQDEEAFITTERNRARSLLDSLVTGKVQLNDYQATELFMLQQKLYTQRQDLRLNLAKAQAAADTQLIASLETELKQVEKQYNDVESQIQAYGGQLSDLAQARSQNNILSLEKIQALLDPNTTLVSYYTTEKYYTLAFLITHDSFKGFKLLAHSEDLNQWVTAYRKFIEAEETKMGIEQASNLHNKIFSPLAPHIKTSHLTIIPHNVLHYLPFQALYNSKTEQYLLEKYNITVLPSVNVLPYVQKNSQHSLENPLIVGNPAFSADLPPLPGAEEEAKVIAKLYNVKPLIGEAATEETVRQKMSQAGIVHLSTHGYFDAAEPLNSLIALAPDNENDGFLTASEIYTLKLDQTGLVVLSACQTQLGEYSRGDDVVGLTRALMFAGTPSIIATLWSVSDAATNELMQRFYYHLQAGAGKSQALRLAQIELMANYPEPVYWAPFILSGDGGKDNETLNATPEPTATPQPASTATRQAVPTATSQTKQEKRDITAETTQGLPVFMVIFLVCSGLGGIGLIVIMIRSFRRLRQSE